jgi:drug/metabolite transporter (DMT)-like permease
MSLRGIIAYGGLAAFWAAFFVGLTVAVPALGVGLTGGIFGVVGGLSLFAMAKAVRRNLVWQPDWAAVLLWASIGLTILLAVALSVSLVGAALSAIVVSSIPLFATVGAQMRGVERVTGLGAVSLLLGIGGLMLVAAFPGGGASWGFLGGVLSALAAAITSGACGRQLGRQLHRPKALETAILAALIIGVASFSFVPFNPPTRGNAMPVLIVVLLAGVVAFLGLFALSSASDSVPRRIAATLPGVGTVLAVAAGVLVLGEPLSAAQLLGMVAILAGTALLRGLVPRWFPSSWRA